MTDLYADLYARVQSAKYRQLDHVEVTRAEVEQIFAEVSYPNKEGFGDTAFGFPAKIVDQLSAERSTP